MAKIIIPQNMPFRFIKEKLAIFYSLVYGRLYRPLARLYGPKSLPEVGAPMNGWYDRLSARSYRLKNLCMAGYTGM
jgi:hypothetical protein